MNFLHPKCRTVPNIDWTVSNIDWTVSKISVEMIKLDMLLFILVLLRLRYAAVNYMFKVNNRNTRTKCEIYSKLTIKTPERRHC